MQTILAGFGTLYEDWKDDKDAQKSDLAARQAAQMQMIKNLEEEQASLQVRCCNLSQVALLTNPRVIPPLRSSAYATA
jgi:hypothetical protein